jgi:hypothetical protein
MPDGAAHAPETFGHFDLVRRFKLGFTDVEVSKWQSRVTGLSVVHLDYDGVCLAFLHRGERSHRYCSTHCQRILRRRDREYLYTSDDMTNHSRDLQFSTILAVHTHWNSTKQP